MSSERMKNGNLKIIRNLLLQPSKFRNTEYHNKACFSQSYKKYGFIETWDVALNLLNNLPDNENVFNELIMEESKVKPYLDIEWLKETYPDYDPDKVKIKIKSCLIKIFNEHFNYKLDLNDIYFTRCHRRKNDGYKYSFHVIVSTHNPSIVFKNSNHASFLAFEIRKLLELDSFNDNNIFDGNIIDVGVYKKTQNIRLPGHCKEGEFSPFLIEDNSNPLEYIITNIDKNYQILNVPEQTDDLFIDLKNIDKMNYNSEEIKIICEKIKTIHPTSYFLNIDSRGYLQFNYKDRNEPCFTYDNKKILHDKIGFFSYVYNNQICIGCHSGNCIEENDHKKGKKIIKTIGNLHDNNNNNKYEVVSFNNDFKIDHVLIRDCIVNGAIGISNLFERMYLNPKRIKWINNSKYGSSYFWDGNLWQEDDYSFIERLLVTTVVKVLRNFISFYETNEELSNNLSEEHLKLTNEIINKLNNGNLLVNILKFVKPLIRDTEFSKIKDIHPYWLSCKNGMVNLITGQLRPSIPDDNITKTLDTEYSLDADSQDFDLFIRQITSNEHGENIELYNFFKWCIGYSLQGCPKKKIFIILYGPHGYNGKSLALNSIKDVLEMYAVAMDSSVVLDNGSRKTAGSHSTELMQLEHCRLGLLSDTNQDAKIDDGKIKQLTGITDKISAREIFGKQKEFTPTFVPFISTNHPIQVNLSDKAMYERLILFPFELSFVDDPKEKYQRKADNSLAEKFKNNKTGILKWLVEASIYYHSDPDKKYPNTIIEARDKYNKLVNTYIDFIDETYIITNNEDDVILRLELIDMYKNYMIQNNLLKQYKAKIAGTEFDNILNVKTIKGKKYYTSIKIIEDIENDIDELN